MKHLTLPALSLCVLGALFFGACTPKEPTLPEVTIPTCENPVRSITFDEKNITAIGDAQKYYALNDFKNLVKESLERSNCFVFDSKNAKGAAKIEVSYALSLASGTKDINVIKSEDEAILESKVVIKFVEGNKTLTQHSNGELKVRVDRYFGFDEGKKHIDDEKIKNLLKQNIAFIIRNVK